MSRIREKSPHQSQPVGFSNDMTLVMLARHVFLINFRKKIKSYKILYLRRYLQTRVSLSLWLNKAKKSYTYNIYETNKERLITVAIHCGYGINYSEFLFAS